METCKNCYGRFHERELVEAARDRYNRPVFVCRKCKDKIEEKGWVYLDEDCPVCNLGWHGFYEAGRRGKHDEWNCRRSQTDTINPDKPWGEHIPLKCSKCGMTGWHTKNIGSIGARTIFWDGKEEECDCNSSFLVPVRE